jgi:anhydro-N-acetylmuramic acid kinase
LNDNLYAGLMSGTSLDAIDAVIINCAGDQVKLLATVEFPFPERLRNRLANLITAPEIDLDHLGRAHRELGQVYANAVTALLDSADISSAAISAIGCHGQTVRHQPNANPPFSLQIGDAAALAAATGVTVVSDFRSADIALGGQGAPLVPAFHRFAFGSSKQQRVVVNIGGIANITVLKTSGETSGFDTGPGNTLMDHWCWQNLGQRFDRDGKWAAEGEIDETLLDSLLTDDYFSLPAPKSTGREHFNAAWLERHLDSLTQPPCPADVQATLAALTVTSIAGSISEYAGNAEIFVCGGGAHNSTLMRQIATKLPNNTVATTAELGIEPDWVEAAAFAWLARARLLGEPGNIPAVTGASAEALLGAVHRPTALAKA